MAISFMHFTGKKKRNKSTRRKNKVKAKRVHRNKYKQPE